MLDDVPTCPECRCPLACCNCGDRTCDDCRCCPCACRDDNDEYDDRDEWPRCGCTYCFCPIRTEYGAPCASCVNHAHQG